MCKQAALRRWNALEDWLRDGAPLWRWLGFAAVICATAYAFPANRFGLTAELADRVRWAGMLLQFAGLLQVAIGLKDSRKLFKKEPIWRAAARWVARVRYVVVPRKPITHVLEPQSVVVSLGATMDAIVTRANRTLGARVADLEQNLTKVQGDVGDLRAQLGTFRSHADQKVEQERSERAEQDRAIKKQLEEATISGIHLELSGLFYLIFGILFATIPNEAAALFQRMGL